MKSVWNSFFTPAQAVRLPALFVLIISLNSCMERGEKSIPLPQVKYDKTAVAPNDTFTVTGNAIIFFEPTEKEESSILSANDRPVYDSMARVFESAAGNVVEYLEKSRILSFVTSARYISVQSTKGIFVYDRLSGSSYLGAILCSPTRLPKVIDTNLSATGYAYEIKNYFFQ